MAPDRIDLGPEPWIAVPRSVLMDVWRKGRAEYKRVGRADGTGEGRPDECWAEFERLAEYLKGHR